MGEILREPRRLMDTGRGHPPGPYQFSRGRMNVLDESEAMQIADEALRNVVLDYLAARKDSTLVIGSLGWGAAEDARVRHADGSGIHFYYDSFGALCCV